MNPPKLPEDLAVMNCATCDRVMCREKHKAQRYGIRAWGGTLHDRPRCTNCMHDALTSHADGALDGFRSARQLAKLGPINGLSSKG